MATFLSSLKFLSLCDLFWKLSTVQPASWDTNSSFAIPLLGWDDFTSLYSESSLVSRGPPYVHQTTGLFLLRAITSLARPVVTLFIHSTYSLGSSSNNPMMSMLASSQTPWSTVLSFQAMPTRKFQHPRFNSLPDQNLIGRVGYNSLTSRTNSERSG